VATRSRSSLDSSDCDADFSLAALRSKFGWSLSNLVTLLRISLFTHRDLRACLSVMMKLKDSNVLYGRCSMLEGEEHPEQDEFRGARLRAYGTNTDNPDEGRIFVWTKTGWFERIEGSTGNVAFTYSAEKWSLKNSWNNRRPIEIIPGLRAMNPLTRMKINNIINMANDQLTSNINNPGQDIGNCGYRLRGVFSGLNLN
jgi:hypothetical protein